MAKIRPIIEEFRPDPRLVDERGPTSERLSIAAGFVERGNASKQYTLRDSPIEKALAKGQITEAEYQAAKKFYGHWYRLGLSGSLQTLELDKIFGPDPGFSGLAESEAREFHREQYTNAVQLLGKRGSSVLERIVCREIEIEQVGREMGWGNRPQAMAAALEALRNSLSILCSEWGIGP